MQREIDITANKSVGSIEVHLVIECKKSDSKQLVLYAPTHNRSKYDFVSPLRFFPRLKPFDQRFKSTWDKLPLFDDSIPVSNNIIFTRGEKVEQNNDSFFSSVNGIIKKSIDWASDGYTETNFRMIFFHLLIYEGAIYQVRDTVSEDFSLESVVYGQYEFPYRFKYPEPITPIQADLNKTARQFGLSNIIEIMHPVHLGNYLEHIQAALISIPNKVYDKWGVDMQEYSKKLFGERETPVKTEMKAKAKSK